mgnify:CR=1 FL=1
MADKHCVLICGYARAGKDTFAKGIIAGARAAKRMAYADNLKNALGIAARDLPEGRWPRTPAVEVADEPD